MSEQSIVMELLNAQRASKAAAQATELAAFQAAQAADLAKIDAAIAWVQQQPAPAEAPASVAIGGMQLGQ